MPSRRRNDGREPGWFQPALPRILAHRGLALGVPENTLASFEQAVAAGVSYIETDVNASADGVAIATHDPTLQRIAGRPERISELTLEQLLEIDLGGGARFVTLADVLAAHPGIRFNIDIKSEDVAGPAARAIRDAGAEDRVLLTSFSTRRRRAAVDPLDSDTDGDTDSDTDSEAVRARSQVAASASAGEFVPALFAAKLGLLPIVRRLLRRVDAVQVPLTIFRMRTTTPRMVRRLHAAGVEVHVWTINDMAIARGLLERGVDGIVTDRADLLLPLAEEFRASR